MYLIIFEDGDITKMTEISPDDFESCNDRYIDIVDITDKNPKKYIDGEWIEIEFG